MIRNLQETEQSSEKSSGNFSKIAVPDVLTTKHFLTLLTAALVLAFPKAISGINTLFYGDFGAMWYPVYSYTRDSFLQGNIPLWNPYIHCGVPFQAQMGQWYPPLLLALILPMPWAINLVTLIHLLWAGLGMYWLVRRWGGDSFAASIAGMAYAFNGVILSSLLWLSYISCLAWLPWVTGSVIEAWRYGGRWTTKATLCAAMQVLSGMPELTLLTWLLLAAVWIVLLTRREIKFLTSVRRLAVIITLSAGISMIQMLPFFDLLANSQRNTDTATALWSMPLWGWANLFVPLFHSYQISTGLWFQPGQSLLRSYYLGVTVLCLGLAAPFLVRNRISILLLILVLLSWMMALGPDGILYAWVRRIIPAIGMARYPVKFAILPAFMIPMLASIAVHRLKSCSLEKARHCLIGIAASALLVMGLLLWIAKSHPFPGDLWNFTAWNTALLAILMLVSVGLLFFSLRVEAARARGILQMAFLGIIPLDAMTHWPGIAPTLPSASLAPGVWQSSDRPRSPRLGEGRIMLSPQAERQLLFSQLKNLDFDFKSKRLGELYNLSLLDNVPKVNGAMPLRPVHLDQVEQAIYSGSVVTHIGPGLFDFLSVAAYSTPENPLVWESRTSYLPVITGGQSPVFASDEVILRSITSDDFDPRTLVYLPDSSRPFVNTTNFVACSLQNTRFQPQKIETDSESPSPTLVVLSQSFYHLWQAFVDDNPAPILRANLGFQAIPIPSGKHHLKLIYKDRYFTIGSIISLLSVATSFILWFGNKGELQRAEPNTIGHEV